MPESDRRPVGRPPTTPAPTPAPAPASWSTEEQKQNALRQALHWTLGLPAIAAAHGEALSARGLELLRRALGERYQEEQGGPPASPLATRVTDRVQDVEFLNRTAEDQHAQEHASLNAGGQLG